MQARRIFILACLLQHPASGALAMEECFCISDDRYGYFEWGCIDLPENGPDAVVCLQDGETGPVPVEYTLTGDWKRVSEGTGLCLPCLPEVAAETLPDRFRSLYERIQQEHNSAQ